MRGKSLMIQGTASSMRAPLRLKEVSVAFRPTRIQTIRSPSVSFSRSR